MIRYSGRAEGRRNRGTELFGRNSRVGGRDIKKNEEEFTQRHGEHGVDIRKSSYIIDYPYEDDLCEIVSKTFKF